MGAGAGRAVRCSAVVPPTQGDDWLGLTTEPLPIAHRLRVVRAGAAAARSCSSAARSETTPRGATGVTHLEYEAYEEQVVPRLEAIAAELRQRWPTTGRVALLHRVGRLELGESSVVVAVSSPHRPRGLRRGPLRHRHAEGVGADLEAGVVDRGRAWGLGATELGRRLATSRRSCPGGRVSGSSGGHRAHRRRLPRRGRAHPGAAAARTPASRVPDGDAGAVARGPPWHRPAPEAAAPRPRHSTGE